MRTERFRYGSIGSRGIAIDTPEQKWRLKDTGALGQTDHSGELNAGIHVSASEKKTAWEISHKSATEILCFAMNGASRLKASAIPRFAS